MKMQLSRRLRWAPANHKIDESICISYDYIMRLEQKLNNNKLYSDDHTFLEYAFSYDIFSQNYVLLILKAENIRVG